MAVKASFFVASTTKHASGQVEVKLRASLQGSRNKEWSKYTPSAELVMQVTSEPAAKWFDDRIGKDVSITFDDFPDVVEEDPHAIQERTSA